MVGPHIINEIDVPDQYHNEDVYAYGQYGEYKTFELHKLYFWSDGIVTWKEARDV